MFEKVKDSRKNLYALGFCALFCFICVTICSRGSFLYSFCDIRDENCFYTVGKCMLRGDVLYQDIYEHKGLYLYFFYMLANLISQQSYIGIYIIELFIGTAYLFTAYKISGLYLSRFSYSMAAAALTAFFTYTPKVYFGGGQCDEFALLPIAITIYIAAKYFKKDYPEKISPAKVIFIGILTAVVFWIKYTMLGAFAGLVIYIIYKQVKNKTYKNIAVYAAEFIFGFIIGSMPAILYFGLNNAFDSLFQVYFYNLLFIYNPAPHGLGVMLLKMLKSPSYAAKILCPSISLLAALLYLGLYKGKRMKGEERFSLLCMYLGNNIMVGMGCNLQYSQECLYAFSVVGIVCAFLFLFDNFKKTKEICLKLLKPAQKIISDIKEKSSTVSLVIYFGFCFAVCALFSNDDSNIKTCGIIAAFAYLLIKLSDKPESVFLKKHTLNTFIKIKYSIIAAVFLSTKIFSLNLGFILILILAVTELIYDFSSGKLQFSAIKEKTSSVSENLRKKKSFSKVLPALCLLIFTAAVFANCKSLYCMGKKLEDYPQYQMSEIIKNSGIEDPAIIHYGMVDSGIYMLTGEYPPCKYFGYYSIKLDETEQTNHEYIDEGKADFIVACKPLENPSKFKIVYSEDYKFYDGYEPTLYLYQRI